MEEPDVQYDFIIYESDRLPFQYHPADWSIGSVVYYREGLKEPEHKLEEPLKPHRGYYWSVRVRRGENVSDWSRFTDYACYGYYSRCGIYKYPFFVFQTPSKTLSAQVVRVIDGDTIEVCCVVARKREKVRYIGINTPETKHPTKEVEHFGLEASEANRKLVEDKTVILWFDVERRDRYGRLLAYVFLKDDTFVNAWLVEHGFAQVMTVPPNVKHQELFLKIQREARDARRGLWR